MSATETPLSIHEALEAPIPPLTDAEAKGLISRLASYDDRLRALKANYDALKKELEERKSWLLATEGERLQLWAAGQLKAGARSRRFLEGVAGWRTTPAKYEVQDEEAAIRYFLATKPEAVVRKLDLSALPKPEELKRYDGETGAAYYETLPGITVRPSFDTFYVKSGAKGAAEEDA